jgi:hypothetical protein
VKYLLKITKRKYIMRSDVILALMIKPMDYQMYKGINAQRNNCINEQSHQPFNKNF